MEEVEKSLMVFINGDSVSAAIICEKARLLYSDITRDTLVLVLKNLRLVKGGLTILKREQRFAVWLGTEKLPVQIKMLLKDLWRSLIFWSRNFTFKF